MPALKAPVPFPWIILMLGNTLRTQLSKYLSIIKQASSTFFPMTFISGEIDFTVKLLLLAIP